MLFSEGKSSSQCSTSVGASGRHNSVAMDFAASESTRSTSNLGAHRVSSSALSLPTLDARRSAQTTVRRLSLRARMPESVTLLPLMSRTVGPGSQKRRSRRASSSAHRRRATASNRSLALGGKYRMYHPSALSTSS